MSSNPRVPFQLSLNRPPMPAPPGGSLIVHVVVNVESWLYDQPMPRKLVSAPGGAESLPDIPNFSWAEYGMRVGMSRILKTLTRRGLPASCALNAGVIEHYPSLVEAIHEAGWEFLGHGLHQRSIQAETSEEAVIGEALDRIEAFTGKPVAGWLGPGLKESEHTVDILKSMGIRFVHDWVLDDLPVWMRTAHGPMIAMPYTLELNDSVVYAMQNHASDEFLRRVVDTLACLDRELAHGPQMLTLGLHPHLIGVPHRFVYLERVLDLLQAHGQAVFMTGSEIADWFEGASVAQPAETVA